MTTQQNNFDFKELADRLRPHISSIVFDLCPGGEIKGNEFIAATIHGGKGTSFRINLSTGKWADFADVNLKGHDVISYYAKCKNLNNGQAARELQQAYLGDTPRPKLNYPVVKKDRAALIKPPPNAAPPQQIHLGLTPAYTWCYRDGQGDPLFYIYRYNKPNNKKDFIPVCYDTTGKWVTRSWPSPRPLYNLDLILKNPDKPIAVCEGEKSADALMKISSAYIATTWPNGSQSVDKADFSPLYGRKVLLWPDADEAGFKAMSYVASAIVEFCEEVKYIQVKDKPEKWDAADALLEGMDHAKFVAWAKPIVEIIKKPALPLVSQRPEVLEAEEVKHVPTFKVQTQQDEDSKLSGKMQLLYQDLGLQTTHRGTRIVLNTANVVKVLTLADEFKGKIWFDDFQKKIMTSWRGPSRPWQDSDDLKMLYVMQSDYEFRKIHLSNITQAVQTTAAENLKNEVRDWMNGLTWDGEPRVRLFLNKGMGADLSEYTEAVSQNFFVSIVARVLNPGCKVDTMMILEGGQGTFKSTSLQILAGSYFAEANSSLDSKDFEQGLVGRMIVEFGELDQFRKAETTLIKKKLSCAVDSYRPSYGRSVVDIPRTCVFVGTTNKDKYLQDETGARRFWPIKVKLCDIEYIKANRDQLFAEAVELYKQGSTWHEVPEQAKAEQEARREQDPYEEYILEWLNGVFDPTKPWLGTQKKERFTTKDVWESALRGDPSRLDMRAQKSIAKSLKALGYEQIVSRDTDRRVVRLWVKTLGFDEINNS